MEFELQKEKHIFKIKMELYENITNVEEIVKKFLENDVLHIFLNPVYVFLHILTILFYIFLKDNLNKTHIVSFE